MSHFVVSARKYRPDHFNTVVGQDQVTSTLKNAIQSGKLAQSFLFCGPRGVGKTSCARILAKTINCTQLTSEIEACGSCDSCLSFQHGNSFNIQELDAASNNSVEDIRSLVEQIRYAPGAGKYKIYIIDEVHMLSQNAFNAFLKTLEEPPAYVIFILATTEKQKIIPTILSRCQIFDFTRITVIDAARHLAYIAGQESIKIQPEALHLIAQKADGAMRDALSMFDQLAIYTSGNITYQAVIDNLHILDFDYYYQVTQAILEEDIAAVLLIYDEINRNGFNGNDFLAGLSAYFRDLLVCKDDSTIHLLEVMPQTQEKYIRHSLQISPSFLLTALSISNQAEMGYRTSKNQRLQVELALMKLCHISSAFRLDQAPEPEILKKKESLNAGSGPDTLIGSSPRSDSGSLGSGQGGSQGDSQGDSQGVSSGSRPIGPSGSEPAVSISGPSGSKPSGLSGSEPAVSISGTLGSKPSGLPIGPSGSQQAIVVADFQVAAGEMRVHGERMADVEDPGVDGERMADAAGEIRTESETRAGGEKDTTETIFYERPDQLPLITGNLPESKQPAIRFKIPKRGEAPVWASPSDDGSSETAPTKRSTQITAQSLKSGWAKLVAEKETEQDHGLYSILSQIQPQLAENSRIMVEIQNSIQEDLIREGARSILQFLRNELTNDSIQFDFKLNPEIREATNPFTASDKLNHLAEINPLLLKLKTQLGLEIDY